MVSAYIVSLYAAKGIYYPLTGACIAGEGISLLARELSTTLLGTCQTGTGLAPAGSGA